MDLQAVQQNWELNDNGCILSKLKLKQQISKSQPEEDRHDLSYIKT